MKRVLAGAALALGLAGPAAAETAYVTDILRLGIHRASDTSDRAFDNLISGTELEVLERNVNYARVRTSEGQEGWVKAAYIVTEKPAQRRVAELEAELAVLHDRVDKAESARTRAEQEAAHAKSEWLAGKASTQRMQDTLARLERQNAEYASRFDQPSLPLTWVGAALVLTLVGGFIGGWWCLDALIRRRHGGYRVY